MTLYFSDLVSYSLPLFLYILSLFVHICHAHLCLLPVLVLLLEEVLDLAQFGAVDYALLDAPLFLFDLQLLKQKGDLDLLILQVLLDCLLFAFEVLLGCLENLGLTKIR